MTKTTQHEEKPIREIKVGSFEVRVYRVTEKRRTTYRFQLNSGGECCEPLSLGQMQVIQDAIREVIEEVQTHCDVDLADCFFPRVQ